MFSFGKPSKQKFANQLMKQIETIDGVCLLRYDAENFQLIRTDGDGQVNLANIYEEHCSLPRNERKQHLIALASVFSHSEDELPDDFEEAKSNLRPKIWNRSTFTFLELKARIEGGKTPDVPLYPVGSHLYSSLVYDTENAMRSISSEDLEKWGTTYYGANEIARQNLEESSIAWTRIGDHFHSALSGDNYDSSRVLLLDRIRSFEVIGEHVAIVPQRDAMYIAGSEDESSLAIMLELTRKTIEEDPRPLCPLPMVLRNDEWLDWRPPKNHVLRPQFDDLELHFLGGLYSDQKELLNELFQVDVDEAAFVSDFSAIQQEDTNQLQSYCVWGRDVDSLLPRTQHIVFADDSGVLASGEWEHVASFVGNLMEEVEDYYPTRYRVREFPSSEQLASIGRNEPFLD